MKYSANSSEHTSSALFLEQVQHVTNIYEQWNDCERTVVAYALFKRLPFANLKLLTHAIEQYLKQNATIPKQLGLLEEAANATTFLNKLIKKYNSLVNFSSSGDNIDSSSSDPEISSNDSIKSLENDLVSKYNSKEEILQDLLMYLPMLRPNNDEGKKVYMQFLPLLIDDSIKHGMPIELVQQILSYLLIHPVIKVEDRKHLHQWLQKLQDHMSMSYSASSNFGGIFLPVDNASSFLSNASSMSSASSSSSASSTTWPTAVPQIQTTTMNPFKTKRDQELFDLRGIQVAPDFDDLNQTKYPLPIGNNSASQNSLNSSSKVNTSASIFDSNDEHHISFSKNGTEVDFDNDFLDSNAAAKGNSTNAMTVNAPTSASNDFLTVPNFYNDRLYDVYGYGGLSDGFSDDGNSMIKTRRSNSLTTPIASGGFNTSSSAENLANLQKPRSFSLSMESSRNALMSCGSEPRLDKLAQMNFNNNSHHVGMSHIPIWLKSLRLHKYQWLFTNMTYEQMMDMTEEYLESLGVTKGARHKLVLCIQKLVERIPQLKQVEKELLDGTRPLKSALDEMMNVVLTPMKPINSVPCEEDVATQLMKSIDCAFSIMQSIKFFTSADEESVNIFLWVLDKALHHEAFVQQIPHLKEYKGKLQRIKMMFSNKMYNGNNSSMGKANNLNKRVWKPKMNNNISENQKCRKNSLPFFNSVHPYPSNNSNGGNMQFSGNFGNLTNVQRSASREKLNQFAAMQQQHHIQFNQPSHVPAYRHSLNSLMPFGIQPQQMTNRRNSSCGADRITSMPSPLGSNEKILNDQGMSMSTSPNLLSMGPANTTIAPKLNTNSDINSRLESLCRQMTEQAID